MVILITAGTIPGTTPSTTILGTMEDGDGAIVLGDGMVGTATMVGMTPGTTAMAGDGEATMVGITTTTEAIMATTGQAIRLTVGSMVVADML